MVWDGAVVWPLAESVGFGCVLWLVGDVSGMLVVRLVVDVLVGGLWVGALVGCGYGMVRCRFRIWCMMVAVGWCLRGVGLVGGGWGGVV